jgi:hypothetical protein
MYRTMAVNLKQTDYVVNTGIDLESTRCSPIE